jgi:multiple sugar transport system substrate-binding protein
MIRYLPLGMLGSLLLGLSGCMQVGNAPAHRPGILRVWAHAGQAAERQVLEQQVKRFNASQTGTTVELTFVPVQRFTRRTRI